MSAIDPTNNTGLIIDDFINYATAHLGTVGGVINTLSIYSPVTPPAPGVISWTGYSVQPAKPSVGGLGQSDLDQFTRNGDDTPAAEKITVKEHEVRNDVVFTATEPIQATFEEFELTTVVTPYDSTKKPELFLEDPGTFDEDINQAEKKPDPPRSKIYGNVGATKVIAPPDYSGKYTNGNLPKSILVSIGSGNNAENGPSYLLHAEAASQYFKLKQAAKDAKVKWTITSAYRTANYQKQLKDASDAAARARGEKESTTVAGAGNSPHGWAVAIDIGELYADANGGSGNPSVNKRVRESSALYRWLSNNAPAYGWYNPYRLADTSGTDECWHWEYWGFYTKST
jgi:LAS superfamily LD-carboxypeptidase LdcB